MENQEIIKPSYEEACMIFKHIIDVDFPTKENITHGFLQKEVLSYITIGGNYTSKIKSALSVVLNEVGKNKQPVKKVVSKDNTDHKLSLNYKKKHIISSIIGEIPYNKETIIENILPIQEEVIIEPKVEKKTQIEENKPDIESIIQPIIKKEKIITNPDTKIWEENIRVIKGIEFSDDNRKISLNNINNIIKKYLSKECYIEFLTQYTKINSQNINSIIEKYQSIEKYIEFLADKDNNIEQDFIVYRIQNIRIDILSKNNQKTPIQKIVMSIQKELNIE